MPTWRSSARPAWGDCWYISAHHRLDTLERQIDLYKRELDAVGKPFPAEMPFRRETFVADSREQAIEMVRPHLGLKYDAYHQWGQDKVMPKGDDDLGQDFDDLLRNRFILGSPGRGGGGDHRVPPEARCEPHAHMPAMARDVAKHDPGSDAPLRRGSLPKVREGI